LNFLLPAQPSPPLARRRDNLIGVDGAVALAAVVRGLPLLRSLNLG
jgi:hypothetical protein